MKNNNTFPRPAPIIALVGVNISGMPGPPLGPSPLITTTLPYNSNEKQVKVKSIHHRQKEILFVRI